MGGKKQLASTHGGGRVVQLAWLVGGENTGGTGRGLVEVLPCNGIGHQFCAILASIPLSLSLYLLG